MFALRCFKLNQVLSHEALRDVVTPNLDLFRLESAEVSFVIADVFAN